MRIAQISPLFEAVPPKLYGGTELVVAHLSDALVALGHEVTLFAAADAVTSATLVAARRQALRLDPNPLKSELACHLCMLDEVRQRADQFDMLHFHTELLHFPLFEDIAGLTLTTIHGRLDIDDVHGAYQRWHPFPLASISRSQQAPLPWANWAGTVQHGLEPSQYAMASRPRGDYLAFLGRASPEKGMDRAIAIARASGQRLKIAAKIDPVDRDYFEQAIRPLLALPGIEFIGEIGDGEKADFLGHAAALLFPIDWPEPFGLVMIEAMACGTPVIAAPCGAVGEIIEDGVTGFLVRGISEAVAAVDRAARLDRAQIREVFDRRFTARSMAVRYMEIYQRVLASPASAVGAVQVAQGSTPA